MARISVFTLIERSNKNMGAANPQVKDLAIELVKRSYHIGINIQITSGLRTYAEQTKLYNQGRTTPGNIVTNAKAGQSIHNFGLAIDYVLISEDGTKAFWDINRNMNGNQVKDWFEVAAIGKQLGFSWGGDWKSFKDYPHLDMQRGYSLASLREGKRPSIPSVPNRGYYGPGDVDKEIGKIQSDLIKLGYDLTKDNAYGKGTEEAVRKFQRASNLVVDGIWGKASQMKVDAIIANLEKPKPKPPVNKPEEVIEMLKQAIVIGSLNDYAAAEILSVRKGIPIFPRNAIKEEVAKELIVVGGDQKGLKADKITNLSGKDRFETAANVQKYL